MKKFFYCQDCNTTYKLYTTDRKAIRLCPKVSCYGKAFVVPERYSVLLEALKPLGIKINGYKDFKENLNKMFLKCRDEEGIKFLKSLNGKSEVIMTINEQDITAGFEVEIYDKKEDEKYRYAKILFKTNLLDDECKKALDVGYLFGCYLTYKALNYSIPLEV